MAHKDLVKDLVEMGSMNQKFAEQVMGDLNDRKSEEMGAKWGLKGEHVAMWKVKLAKRLRTMRRHTIAARIRHPRSGWITKILGSQDDGGENGGDNEKEISSEEEEGEEEESEEDDAPLSKETQPNVKKETTSFCSSWNANWVYRYESAIRTPIRYIEGKEKQTKMVGMVVCCL